MGVEVQGRGAARNQRVRDPEITKLEYGTAIAMLVAIAALLILSGCSADGLKGVDGAAKATPSPLRFGVVPVESVHQISVAVENRGDAPLVITSIEPVGNLPPDFLLPSLPGAAIPVAGSVSLDFGFRPGDERAYTGKVLLHTDSAESPTLEIEMEGEGARPMLSCTERLDFGRIVLNTDKILRITCVNGGRVDAPVRVSGKDGDDQALFTVGANLVSDPTVVPAGASQLIEVRYQALHLGRATARAFLEVPGALEPTRIVELSGEGFASDLSVQPNCIHFGAVSPGATAQRTLSIYNGGNRTVNFQAPQLFDSSGVFGVTRTVVDGVETPLTGLDAGKTAELTVTFAPSAVGDYAGSLEIRNDDPTNPRLEICLTGQGGGADVLVSPTRIDFGRIAVGMRARAWVMVSNGGSNVGGPLQLLTPLVEDPANFTVRAPTVTQIAAGDPAAIYEVEFHPQGLGSYSTNLIIKTNDGDQPDFPVAIVGEAANLPPCDYVAEPPSLRFGTVQLGAAATLAAKLRNVGAEECIFSSVALAPGSDAEFSQPGGAIGVVSVMPGASISVPVRFQANAVGDYTAAVGYYVSDPANPQGSIPILASSFTGCLTVEPGAIDFGTQRTTCPPAQKTVRLTNACTQSVRINSAALGAGTMTAGEISFVGPAAPLDLAPNQSASFTVRYAPVDVGHDGAPLLFDSAIQPVSVPIHGEGTNATTRTDTFNQRQRESVDVLFVVDNSGSMMEEQQAIGDAFDEFIGYAVNQGIDYHIGVTTTGITASGGGWAACPGGVDGGEAGRLFPATGGRARYITPSTPNAAAIFDQNVQVGVCHWWEEGLEAAYRALSSPLVDSADAPNTTLPNDGNLGFYRPDARLAVIVVTDEDDHSDKDPSFYLQFFRNLKGPANADKVTVHGVLGNGCSTASGNGDRYGVVISGTGGTTESICTSDWGRSLVNLAQSTFGFSLRFPLTGTPVGNVTVKVNGRVVNTGWSYDAAANAVVFTENAAPAPGARIEVTYTPACGS